METPCPYGVIFTYIVQWRDMEMKRIFSILLITALLLSVTPLMGTVALAEEYATVTSTNGYGVRMREGPSKGYAVVGKYDVGTTVIVLQSGTEWSQIQIGETVGWMMNEYLIFGATGSSSGSGDNVTGVANATVTSGNGLRVWLRATAGGKRLALYSPGTGVKVLEYGDNWCRVSIGGAIGYMMTDFLAFEKAPEPGSLKLTAASLNYDYPVVGDVMEVITTPADATVKYSWKVDGVELGTEETFNVLTRYANQRISVTVTGIGAYAGSVTDTALADVQISRAMKSVALSTTSPVVGDVISAIIQPSSAVVEYSWRVAGVEVSTDATYTVTASDIGKLIQLKVKGIDGYEGSVACTAKDNVVSDKAIQSVKLSKYYPVVGETVTATVYPVGAAATYTWTVDGEVVSETASYKVDFYDLGKQVQVTVKGADPYTGTASDITKRVAAAELTGVRIAPTTPVTGDRLYAYVTPANATAEYEWYKNDEEVPFAFGSSSLYVDESLAGDKISVKATGTGVYSNTVESAKTAAVIDRKVITGVALSNSTPVVGDTIRAYLAPRNADPSAQTYAWYIDNEVSTKHGWEYEVKESDIGKVIRVKVTGAGIYTGEAYSNYSSPVVGEMLITGVGINNASTGANACQVQPEVGHTLSAVVTPGQATAAYEWSIDGTVVGTDADYSIKAEDAGKRIMLSATGTGNYKTWEDKPVTALSAAVVQLKPLNVELNIPAPEQGMTPVTSTTYKVEDKEYKANVRWVTPINEDEYVSAELDRYGLFKPNETYVARVSLTLPDGYTMIGSSITAAHGSTVRIGNTTDVFVKYAPTGAQQVTDYYIAEVAAPVVGQKGTTSFSTTQYDGVVTWTNVDGGVFENAESYTATIELTANLGYTLDGLEENIFQVGTADETYYDASSYTVTAVFNVERMLKVSADKSEVYLDGYNSRVVQCKAELSNYIGDITNIKWEIVEATVDGTSINDEGQLIIGMYETPDRTLTIRATVTLSTGEEYVGTTTVVLVSGTDTDTAIKVEFTEAANMIARKGKGYYEAKVTNSTQGCTIFAIWDDSTSQVIGSDSGWLNISATEKANKIVVRAISNEDHSVVASVLVQIVDSLPLLGVDEIILVEGELAEETLVEMIEVSVEEVPAVEEEAVEEVPAEPSIEITEPEAPVVEEEAVEEVPAEPSIEITEPEAPVVEEEAVEEVPAEPSIEITEPEAPVVEEEVVEEVPAEPSIEITEPEAPVVEEEVVEEVPAEPSIEITEPEAPVVEEEVVEEVPAEPSIEITEPEAPVVEEEVVEEVPAEPSIEITEPETPVVEEEVVEEVPAEPSIEITEPEAPVVEEAPEGVVIEIKDTVTGEVVAPEEEPEAPAVEEEEPEGVVIAIKDTVTGEVIEEQEEEPAVEEETEQVKKPSKSEKKNEEVAEEVTEEELLDPELDDVEGDKDVGESTAESTIKIRFTEKASQIKRGGKAQFAVEVEGSEQGVRWSVRRSKDADGKKVSSISEDGLLVVSKAETAEKLVVVATSVEDGSVRARWIVTVKNASKSSKADDEEEIVEEEIIVEETVTEEAEEPADEVIEEIVPEDEGLSEEILKQIQEELDKMMEENAVLDHF